MLIENDLKESWVVLSLYENAPLEIVKQAYRRLALKWHPDKNPAEEAKQRFQEIGLAYHAICDYYIKANEFEKGLCAFQRSFLVPEEVMNHSLFISFLRKNNTFMSIEGFFSLVNERKRREILIAFFKENEGVFLDWAGKYEAFLARYLSVSGLSELLINSDLVADKICNSSLLCSILMYSEEATYSILQQSRLMFLKVINSSVLRSYIKDLNTYHKLYELHQINQTELNLTSSMHEILIMLEALEQNYFNLTPSCDLTEIGTFEEKVLSLLLSDYNQVDKLFAFCKDWHCLVELIAKHKVLLVTISDVQLSQLFCTERLALTLADNIVNLSDEEIGKYRFSCKVLSQKYEGFLKKIMDDATVIVEFWSGRDLYDLLHPSFSSISVTNYCRSAGLNESSSCGSTVIQLEEAMVGDALKRYQAFCQIVDVAQRCLSGTQAATDGQAQFYSNYTIAQADYNALNNMLYKNQGFQEFFINSPIIDICNIDDLILFMCIVERGLLIKLYEKDAVRIKLKAIMNEKPLFLKDNFHRLVKSKEAARIFIELFLDEMSDEDVFFFAFNYPSIVADHNSKKTRFFEKLLSYYEKLSRSSVEITHHPIVAYAKLASKRGEFYLSVEILLYALRESELERVSALTELKKLFILQRQIFFSNQTILRIINILRGFLFSMGGLGKGDPYVVPYLIDWSLEHAKLGETQSVYQYIVFSFMKEIGGCLSSDGLRTIFQSFIHYGRNILDTQDLAHSASDFYDRAEKESADAINESLLCELISYLFIRVTLLLNSSDFKDDFSAFLDDLVFHDSRETDCNDSGRFLNFFLKILAPLNDERYNAFSCLNSILKIKDLHLFFQDRSADFSSFQRNYFVCFFKNFGEAISTFSGLVNESLSALQEEIFRAENIDRNVLREFSNKVELFERLSLVAFPGEAFIRKLQALLKENRLTIKSISKPDASVNTPSTLFHPIQRAFGFKKTDLESLGKRMEQVCSYSHLELFPFYRESTRLNFLKNLFFINSLLEKILKEDSYDSLRRITISYLYESFQKLYKQGAVLQFNYAELEKCQNTLISARVDSFSKP